MSRGGESFFSPLPFRASQCLSNICSRGARAGTLAYNGTETLKLDDRLPAVPVTRTSMSLAGPKSSLGTEPNNTNSCIFHLLQNASISWSGSRTFAFVPIAIHDSCIVVRSPSMLAQKCNKTTLRGRLCEPGRKTLIRTAAFQAVRHLPLARSNDRIPYAATSAAKPAQVFSAAFLGERGCPGYTG